jgi:Protein tyrosine/serine phosphatase
MAFFSCNSGNNNDSSRVLPLEGGFNFRDMGGYKTVDSKTVKWGKVFRSDEMGHLASVDLDYLSNIPLLTVVDFRSLEEIEASPDKIPSSVISVCKLTINPGNHSNISDLSKLTEAKGEEFMKEINRAMVSDSAITDAYKAFFALLQNEKQIPLLFHCTAGKDRTGLGAALFLASLGVDEKTIFDDYLLSNQQLVDKYKNYTDSLPQLKPLFEVRPQYLRAAFDKIIEDHGSVEVFLHDVLDVDTELMKALYLELF